MIFWKDLEDINKRLYRKPKLHSGYLIHIKKIIETGTYHGWSTIKLSEFEKEVVSIEISPENYAKAVENIKKNNLSNVEILLGSSPEILENLVSFDEKNLLIFYKSNYIFLTFS